MVVQRRWMRVTKDSACIGCNEALEAGSRAWWDVGLSQFLCEACADGGVVIPTSGSTAVMTETRAKAEAPPAVARPLTVTAALDDLRARDCLVLHGRHVPDADIDIDHLVVNSRGVVVVISHRTDGKVERRDVVGWNRSEVRLYVAGADQHKLLMQVRDEARAVAHALGREFADIAVIPTLCFVGAQWPPFSKPFIMNGVRVAAPWNVQEVVRKQGTLSVHTIHEVAVALSTALPPSASITV